MDLTGDYRIPAPRETVWAALNDPEVLRACIPGCEELNKTSDTELVAKVVAKIGPVKAAFGGKVTLSDLDPPNGYTITGEGQGGAAGFAKGGAKVRLEAVDGGAATVLYYAADAQIGGKIAQLGGRLIAAGSAGLSAPSSVCWVFPRGSGRSDFARSVTASARTVTSPCLVRKSEPSTPR